MTRSKISDEIHVVAADPVLVAPISRGAVREANFMVTEGVQSGSLATFSQASGMLAVPQQFSQDASMQSSSESGAQAAFCRCPAVMNSTVKVTQALWKHIKASQAPSEQQLGQECSHKPQE